MKRLLAALCLLGVFCFACEGEPTSRHGSALEPSGDGGSTEPLRWGGRWAHKGGTHITTYPGAYFEGRFNGTGLTAWFEGGALSGTSPAGAPSEVAWQIDGGAWQEASASSPLALASGLTSAVHDVRFVVRALEGPPYRRWTLPLQAFVALKDLEVAGGELVPLPPLARRRVEFLGDSITEGVHSRFTGWTQAYPQRNDGRQAFPALVAQALGLDYTAVGIGGQGITRPGAGGAPPAPDAWAWIYDGEPYAPSATDAVVTNFGANDCGALDVFGFDVGGDELLRRVRATHEHAEIVVLRPFSGDGACIELLRSSVETRRRNGDARVRWVDTLGWLAPGDYAEGVHPNLAGHQKIAEQLAPVLANVLGLP